MRPSLLKMKHLIAILIVIGFWGARNAAGQRNYQAIHSGIPWFDQNDNTVNAHGACIVNEGDKFYLFGEYKTDSANMFIGFSCYSSTDLMNWKFEKIVLEQQPDGLLGPNRIGERVKVMKCPETGEFVMFMHTDDRKYNDPHIGYATCETIDGDYQFQGALLYDGEPIRKWDMGTFKDTDGKGYLLIHHGTIYALSTDYKSAKRLVVSNVPTGESPTVFKAQGIYFWLSSHLTSWERNDNYYMTAPSLEGPWKMHGAFAPKGTLTWNSQCTFVLPIAGTKDTTFMYMGDRWAFPIQKSAATYVWQPLIISGDSIALPTYKESWQVNPTTGSWSTSPLKGRIIENSDTAQIKYTGEWVHTTPSDRFSDTHSDVAGDSFSLEFKGTQFGIFGVARPNGGYARIELLDPTGKTILSNLIDLYCKYPESSLKFLSPVLTKGPYKLHVTVVGKHGNWYSKNGTEYGSSGNTVSVNK
ncbi:MAG TPA: family 43 glycosylhydrolase, partial [Prolixibacteraceae bacterium]|nr:family 43 glycosylhydrolase [Prolixibacteraceae bacterium]